MVIKKHIKPLIFIILVIILWFAVSNAQLVSTYLLPTPQMVFKTLIKEFSSGAISKNILVSSIRVFKGFGISFLLAFVIAMFTLLFPKLNEYYEFYIQFFRNVPPLSLIPLLILWCGIGETTKILIIVLASFFPMYLNIVKGFSSCDTKLIEVGTMFGFSKLKIFAKIILPNALSDILVGMRVGLGYSWRAIIGAEMIAASSGLGYAILFAQQMSRTDKVIVGIIIIGLLGCLCDFIFGWIIKKFLRGTDDNGWN